MPRHITLDGAVLLGRLLIAALFLHEAYVKLGHIGPSMAYMERFGLPGLLLFPAIALELGGGLALVTGLGARHAALALAGFSLVAATLFHGAWTDGNQLLHFEKDLAIAGGLLTLFAVGPGRFALSLPLGGMRTG